MYSWTWLIAGTALGAVSVLPYTIWRHKRDVKRTEEARSRAQASERMAEIGNMTSGLAHEIKNPLSTVGLNAQLLAEDIDHLDAPEKEKVKITKRLDSLSREVHRLKGILDDFLQFAGRMKLHCEEIDLRLVLSELEDFYHPQCDRESIVMRMQMPEKPVMANVDASLLKQAVLNLLINATHAMQDSEQKELMVRLKTTENEACIHIIDTGNGIEEDRISEIFHPYVSSKQGGTGLGLPTALRIAQEHGGQLVLNSTVGQGSDFTLCVPLYT
ncbi:MAG: HAMP domain-containing histidine kinase [Phycisphaerae bacterium]|jgi:signal transduction histidine kinase|nr:HAMP domain-containing histidine kinase [Phycisphaerae bacterium]MBT5366066.1 HAMP domain-containing histidine kinase [Phycisphaerae bacterium]MBT6269874.1 HAMP domain-containing histidine kinase [Phycisphaerae bacterium]